MYLHMVYVFTFMTLTACFMTTKGNSESDVTKFSLIQVETSVNNRLAYVDFRNLSL